MAKTITPEMLERVQSGKKSFGDPCVICGNQFNGGECTHTVEETEVIFHIVEKMTKEQKAALRGQTVQYK